MRKAIVVGGGIGGLSAAIGLHGIGWEVTVLEQAPELTAVGAGISLWPNALRSLEALGVHLDKLQEQSSGGLHDRNGRRITRWDADAFRRHHGRPLAAIHRADLIEALLDALPAGCVRTGTAVTGLADLDADVVVAADGIHSGLRKQLWPRHPEPVYSGSTAFRAVTTLPHSTELSTSWDDGAEIGVIPLHDGRVYWWASYVAEAGIRHATRKPICGTASAAGTNPSPISSAPPRPRRCSTTTSTCSALPCRPTCGAASRSSATRRTRCRRSSAKAAARRSKTPSSSPPRSVPPTTSTQA